MDRKLFLRVISYSILLPVGYIAGKMMIKQEENQGITTKLISGKDLYDGINFFNEVLVFKKGSLIRVYSSKCTHAGCKIVKSEGNELICACHGSRFDIPSGVVRTGPAFRDLVLLPFTSDSKTGDLSISLTPQYPKS